MNNKRSTLSIAPYYGGKGRMAHFIADRLDYKNTDVFVTPFGGMCRVLLNKPRHRVECYNDFSSGLNALMSVLSDPIKANTFIHKLYDETEFSEEEFLKQRDIFYKSEYDLEVQEKEKLRKLLINYKVTSAVTAPHFLDAMFDQIDAEATLQEYSKPIMTAFQDFYRKCGCDSDFKEKFDLTFSNWVQLRQKKEAQGFLERSTDMGEYVSEMDLAVATYIVFLQSRDGMGQVWSSAKFRSTDDYLRRVLTLYECADRMEGVHIYQIDAVDFFRRWKYDTLDPKHPIMNEWIGNPNVMMYCDPSYISPESEKELLDGIDINHVDSVSDAIRQKYGDRMPKNLGKIYACSFGYEEQENFVRCIQNAKCKIMVSNYDLALYNKYLTESAGWRREEFFTTTAVGGKVDNSRTEVIWYKI